MAKSTAPVSEHLLRGIAVTAVVPAGLWFHAALLTYQVGSPALVVQTLGVFGTLFLAFGTWLFLKPVPHPASFLASWAIFSAWYALRVVPLRPGAREYTLLAFAVLALGVWVFSLALNARNRRAAA